MVTAITRGPVTQLNASNRAKLVTFLDPTPANDAIVALVKQLERGEGRPDKSNVEIIQQMLDKR